MEDIDAVASLAALAQPTRLAAFRALVVAGPAGLTHGALAEALAVPAATLSFHLKELTHAGLLSAERDGRHLIYRAAFARMQALIGYLTAHCCEGARCEATAAAEGSACGC